MREEGGSRWPYLLPALGRSRGGKKYLKQQEMGEDEDDKYTDGEGDDNIGIQRGNT